MDLDGRNKAGDREREGLDVAIIGIAGRFPGANDSTTFWRNLRDGVESISVLSTQDLKESGVPEVLLNDPQYVRSRAIMEGIDLFDAGFFGFTPREAELLDPQQRVFLECAWEAFEHAGYDPERFQGSIGVYAGSSSSGYLFNLFPCGVLLQSAADMAALLSVEKDSLPTRVSYKLNLEGPSLAVQTACSTSLVAVHLACQGLLTGECDMALAGGISISVPQKVGYLYQKGGIASPDGHCRAFDTHAQGTVGGSGVGIAILKRLEEAQADGDHILAVLKGSAINNDGARKVGYTAPRVEGQAKVIRAAQMAAGVEPDSISYVEAHGTGTPIGDPIEVAALTQAFRVRTNRNGFCALGSVKTNIGHLDAAAGIAGLIKTVLALSHKQIPPSLHFTSANPEIDFYTTPFYVNTTLQEWRRNGTPRRAGVSSFGLGGTNAHVILEEAPQGTSSHSSRNWHLLPLSARTPVALEAATARLLDHLRQRPDQTLSDVAFTLQTGRRHFAHRRVVICRDHAEACCVLEGSAPERVLTGETPVGDRSVAFLFPGQGAQHVEMAMELYREEAVFREEVDRCVKVLKPYVGCDLREVLYPGENQKDLMSARLNQTAITQPALFVVEYSLAKLWMAWGVTPEAMLGHSIGEYAAACLAGVFSLEEALIVVAARGRLLQSLPRGAMLAVALPEEEARLLDGRCSVGAVNGSALSVLSGPTEAIDAVAGRLADRGITTRRLHVSHAFHSNMVEPILSVFRDVLETVTFGAPVIPFLSNVSGQWITTEDATNPDYWVRHLRQTVQFAAGLEELLKEPNRILLEVGPGETLSALARRQLSEMDLRYPRAKVHVPVISSLPHPQKRRPEHAHVWESVSQLWLAGGSIDWPRLYVGERRSRVPLPTYPFERQRYWVDADRTNSLAAPRNKDGAEAMEGTPSIVDQAKGHPRPALRTPYCPPESELEQRLTGIWQELLKIDRIGSHDSFFELGGESLMAVQLLSQVRSTFQREVAPADFFEVPTVAGLACIIARIDSRAAHAMAPSIAHRTTSEPPPLSFSQERLWFVDQLESGSSFYHLSVALRIKGGLDLTAVEHAFNEIVRRHEVLRTAFVTIDGRPVQIIAPERYVSLTEVDLTALPKEEQETAVSRLASQEARRPFQLDAGLLMRVNLVRLGEQEHVLLLTMHHIVSDGWSLGILVREFAALYQGYVERRTAALPKLPIQYADYACWQRRWLSDGVLEQSLSYWKKQLQGCQPRLALPTDRARPASQTYRGASCKFSLSMPLAESLKEFSRQHNTTLFTTLLAAFQVVLYRYSGQDAFCIGTPMANRTRAEIEPLIGFFVNTVVLRADLSGDPSFTELAMRVRETVLGAQSHQDVPFEKLVETLQPVRDLSYSPLFQVMFSLDRAHLDDVEIKGLKLSSLEIETQHSRYDLTLDMTGSGESLSGVIEYSTDLFDRETIVRLSAHYQMLLEGIVAHPEACLSDLPILTEEERHRTLVKWNATKADYPHDYCLHQLFEDQVARTPDAVAVQYDDQWLTYRQLDAQANQVACALQALGVGPDILVGLCVERSIAMLVGVLGTLKAGGAYVPIDPSYPKERIAFMLMDANVSVLLTQRQNLPQTLPPYHAPVLYMDQDGTPSSEPVQPRAVTKATSGNLAYVIYTSGSTGRPKGVMISHRNAVNFLCSMRRQLAPKEHDGVLAVTSLSFDIALLELFLPLMVGAKVVLADRETGHDGARLLGLLERSGISLMQATPATWRMLLEAGWKGTTPLTVLCGGEALSTDLAARLLKPGVRLWNLYGPTETTVWSVIHPMTSAAGPVLIGHPIANTQVYILDPHLQPVPIGVSGEIYIGGAGLARGYWKRPDLTAERFVPNPFGEASGACLYRTGDLGRWRSDGNIECLGRLDHQVKIRGYRIEPGEIEARLTEHPQITQAVVVVHEDPDGEKRLVGYLLTTESLSGDTLRDFLRDRLPEYMIPAIYVFLDRLPLTPNGKVDRQALPAPDEANQGARYYEAPRTVTEETLAAAWSDVLGVQRVGIHDNFFELGGDSILSIQVISRIRQRGITVSPRQLFQHQTIAQLAPVVSHSHGSLIGDESDLGEIPLTPIQQWFFELGTPNPHHWNQSLLLELKRPLDPSIVGEVVAHLVAHHDALRLRFDCKGTEWTQRYVEKADQQIVHVVDLSMVPVERQRAVLDEEIDKWEASLDLIKGPLLRVVYFEHGETQPDSLLFIIHHLVTDGISWRILIGDFHLVYGQIASGKKVELPAKSTSYARWARRLLEHAQSGSLEAGATYWLNPARSLVRPFPVDDPMGDKRERVADAVHVWLGEAETEALLHNVPSVYHTQINDLLLTALVQTLGRWTGHSEVLIDLEGHGREDLFPDLDISRTVGWFAGVCPVLLTWSFEASLADSLKSIKEQLRRLPRGGIGYGMLRYLDPLGEIGERMRAYPASQVRFNYLGQIDHVLPPDSPFLPSINAAGVDRDPEASLPYELDINSDILGKRLHMSWSYSRCRFHRNTIERLSRMYLETLTKLIRHCLEPGAGGYTPSDFPLSGLDQSEIDRIFGAQREIEDVYPLTALQQGLLIHSLHTPDPGLYIEQVSCTVAGEYQNALFQRALQETIDRHQVLRTSFVWEGLREPLQVVHSRVVLEIEQDDWRSLSSEEQEGRLRVFLETNRKRGVDLSKAPLIRLAMICISESAHLLVWCHHHILLDGWCVSLLLKEVFSRYEALRQGEWEPSAASYPYRDHIAWLKRQDLAAAEGYWRASLAGFTAPTPLPAHRTTSSTLNSNGVDYANQSLRLSKAETVALSAFAQRHQVTLNTLIQGAWTLLLSRYSGEEDVLFGVTVSGRSADLPGVESMIGLFLNTLPLRVRITPGATVREWLQALLAQNIEMREYEYAPLLQIQRWSEVPRGQPLFESLLVFENYPMDQGLSGTHGSLTLSDVAIESRTHYPLTVDVAPGVLLNVSLGYDRRFFDDNTIRRILRHFQTVLEGIVAQPEARLSELPVLTEGERHRMQRSWNATRAEYPQSRCVHELFELQAESTPDAVAVVHEGESFTYAALNARANQLAHFLRRYGVGPDVVVGLCMERSLGMLVGLLGILKAGGAYLPLDPTYPKERLTYILEDARVRVLLTHQSLLHELSVNQVQAVCLDRDWSSIAQESVGNPDWEYERRALAYVIYTSGSTGKPKGVMVSHNNVVNFLLSMVDHFRPTSNDIVLATTSLSFDIAVLELFLPLLVGGKVVLASRQVAADGEQLVAMLADSRATFMQATPTTWKLLFSTDWPTRHELTVLCGGEAFPRELAGQFLEKGYVPWNLYGPTETTVWSAAHRVTEAAGTIPLGRPIANTQLYVLDRWLQPVPIGVPGELHIGGDGVARGYWSRPELTAEKFVPDPFSSDPGRRLYKTGDLARYGEDGTLEFLGRLDHQIKLRGHRIELGEIEAVLSLHPAVRNVVAMVREDRPDDRRLVVYLVPQPGQRADHDEVRQFLKHKLPEYMIPAAVVVLDVLPITPNGKVDRKALSVPEITAQFEDQYVAPRTPAEEILARIWAETLGVERVGIHDNFFELGGHSLLATSLISRIREACCIKLALADLFSSPTVAELARKVEGGEKILKETDVQWMKVFLNELVEQGGADA